MQFRSLHSRYMKCWSVYYAAARPKARTTEVGEQTWLALGLFYFLAYSDFNNVNLRWSSEGSYEFCTFRPKLEATVWWLDSWSLNDKSQNSFGFEFKSGKYYVFFLVFELGLVSTQICLRCRFQIWWLLAT